MKGFLILAAIFASLVSAQMLPSPMPQDSAQYEMAQQLLSAIHGFQEDCSPPSEPFSKDLKRDFDVYQTVCGGYFLPSPPPLDVLDEALSEYEPTSAWQRVGGDGFNRVFTFGSGELAIYMAEIIDEAVIFITYQEPKQTE